eukprot:scaffold433_cov257-Pinguiococcus_pyrenoidosus.AAC.12
MLTSDPSAARRVAFVLLTDLLEQFTATVAGWQAAEGPEEVSFPQLQEAIIRFQDPAEADSIVKIQKQIDETKDVLHNTIDNLLARGEKLDRLVERSDELSMQSKMFYRQARKTNSCCVIA